MVQKYDYKIIELYILSRSTSFGKRPNLIILFLISGSKDKLSNNRRAMCSKSSWSHGINLVSFSMMFNSACNDNINTAISLLTLYNKSNLLSNFQSVNIDSFRTYFNLTVNCFVCSFLNSNFITISVLITSLCHYLLLSLYDSKHSVKIIAPFF